MKATVAYDPDMRNMGPVVVAMGVFDGVHRGHQELIACAARNARELDVPTLAVTFDRDPDQVVSPDTAAPQLLVLADKCRFLLDAGADTVLVIPFTPEVAAMPARHFLDYVLAKACEPLAIHVGHDFRFGARAEGDIEALRAWGRATRTDIHGHELVLADGAPITSTRIRGLIAAGDVSAAEGLLGRPHRVIGTVVHGRGVGTRDAVATANIALGPHDALPADGVYAGCAMLPDGGTWPAGISVGVPPTFPEATDTLEAHLIGYEGSLYDLTLVLEFYARLRDQRSFDSTDELKAAIAADLDAVLALFPETEQTTSAQDEDPDLLEDDELVDDPEALAEAEAIANADSSDTIPPQGSTEWPLAMEPRQLSGFLDASTFPAFALSAPLEAAGIPYVWDPYPPGEMAGFRPAYGAFDRPFGLRVPPEYLEEARALIAETTAFEVSQVGAEPENTIAWSRRTLIRWTAGLFFAALFADVIYSAFRWLTGE